MHCHQLGCFSSICTVTNLDAYASATTTDTANTMVNTYSSESWQKGDREIRRSREIGCMEERGEELELTGVEMGAIGTKM